MSGVFQNVPPAFGAGGGHTRWVERGWGVNILEDTRHCSVLYICKSPGWNCLGEKLRDGSSVHMQLSSTRFPQRLKLLYVQKS
jgi:hypothetical protein